MPPPTAFVRVGFDLPLGDEGFVYAVGDLPTPRPGCRVRAPLGNRRLTGIVLETFEALGLQDPSPDRIRPLEAVLDEEPLLTESHFRLARWMAERYACSVPEALHAMMPSAVSDGTAPVPPRRRRNLLPPASLTEEQARAAAPMIEALRAGRPAAFLLYGVTGSGKSEIYYHLIAACLEQGRSAVLLVPEINLSVQVLFQMGRYFDPGIVSVLHSRMSPNRRLAEWKAIAEGRKRIVVGARSAVFAPVRSPGLFILDEEQSSSYKEHAKPRYHARQVAWFRAREEDAVLVLGSATPSLETYHYAKKGLLKGVYLGRRYGRAVVPEVRVVLRKDPASELTPELVEAIRDRLDRREQVLVLHNRRGFADVLICGACGQAVRCPDCSVSLTYHKVPFSLRCHYCGRVETVPPSCPACGVEGSLLPVGAGTQKLETILSKLFPTARVARFDADSTRGRHSAEKVYFAFLNREIDILVGTQMLGKGLHFPGVSLAGVVDFEEMAALPDFRSFENTYSLLVQLAGRTGREGLRGEVIIQARDPHHPLLAFLKTGGFEAFYREEIRNREEAGYPPFRRLVRVLFRSEVEEEARKAAEEAVTRLREAVIGSGGEILGPVAAPLARLQRHYRWHLIVKAERLDAGLTSLLRSLQTEEGSGKVRCEVDPDPVSLL